MTSPTIGIGPGLAVAVAELGRLDLLVNNASVLGPSPQPGLADYPVAELERVFAVNAIAPIALAQIVMPLLQRSGGRIVNVSSDAAVGAYEGWGGYGSSKAALDQLTAVLAAEHPEMPVYAIDPGDMATEMHQRAYPGEDISDRPSPESVVPARPAADRGRSAERPLWRGRARAGARPMTTARSAALVAPTTRFVLPAHGEAAEPPERRGIARDAVRLLMAGPDGVAHHHFRDLPELLAPGDLVVVNTSATVAAALDARRTDGRPAPVHVSAPLDDGRWVVELRRRDGRGPDLEGGAGRDPAPSRRAQARAGPRRIPTRRRRRAACGRRA